VSESPVYEHLELERHGQVTVLRIDRPPANAMDLSLLEEGHRCMEELAASKPGAVVITGRDGFFSAGVDLKLAPTLDAEGQRGVVAGINRLFAGWYSFPRPVVCAVNGHAIAGGMILALCGDYRLGAAGDAQLGLTELRAGMPFPAVAMAVVRAELSPAVARRLVLRAHLVGPAEALEMGVLDEVVPPEALESRALEAAAELAALPASAYAVVKEQLRGETLPDGAMDPLLGGWLPEEAEEASAAILRRG
jgi:enoyl-CoA hydratase